MKKITPLILTLFFIIGCNNSNIERTKDKPYINSYGVVHNTVVASKDESNITEGSEIETKKESVNYKGLSELNATLLAKLNKVEIERIKSENLKRLKEIEAQNREKIEQIKADKEMKIKELETQKEIKKALALKEQKAIDANTTLMLAKINSETAIKTEKERIFIAKAIAIMVVVIILIWLMFYYMNKASKRKHEETLKEQELKYKAHIEEAKLKNENIGKMLEILKDKDADKEIKREITKILAYEKMSEQRALLSHKKSESGDNIESQEQKDSNRKRDENIVDIEDEESSNSNKK